MEWGHKGMEWRPARMWGMTAAGWPLRRVFLLEALHPSSRPIAAQTPNRRETPSHLADDDNCGIIGTDAAVTVWHENFSRKRTLRFWGSFAEIYQSSYHYAYKQTESFSIKFKPIHKAYILKGQAHLQGHKCMYVGYILWGWFCPPPNLRLTWNPLGVGFPRLAIRTCIWWTIDGVLTTILLVDHCPPPCQQNSCNDPLSLNNIYEHTKHYY